MGGVIGVWTLITAAWAVLILLLLYVQSRRKNHDKRP